METIQAVRPALDEFIKNKQLHDDSEVIAALQELDEIEIDSNMLLATQVQKVLTQLSKDKRSEKVAKLSKELVKKWRTACENDLKSKSPSAKRKREETTPAESKKLSNSTSNIKSASTPKTESEETPTKTKASSSKSSFAGNTNNPGRNQVQSKLCQALGNCSVQGGRDPADVAVDIEEALFKAFNEDAKNKDYLSKFRSLFSNLKDEKNLGLRNALFTGDLNPERLIQMSYEELANPELQQKRKDLSKFQTEARRGDRHLSEATCSMFNCHKCGQNKTTYFQLQTRSADEPMTTFVTCCNCGNHWKF